VEKDTNGKIFIRYLISKLYMNVLLKFEKGSIFKLFV
jgi:hypothetical protein